MNSSDLTFTVHLLIKVIGKKNSIVTFLINSKYLRHPRFVTHYKYISDRFLTRFANELIWIWKISIYPFKTSPKPWNWFSQNEFFLEHAGKRSSLLLYKKASLAGKTCSRNNVPSFDKQQQRRRRRQRYCLTWIVDLACAMATYNQELQRVIPPPAVWVSWGKTPTLDNTPML